MKQYAIFSQSGKYLHTVDSPCGMISAVTEGPSIEFGGVVYTSATIENVPAIQAQLAQGDRYVEASLLTEAHDAYRLDDEGTPALLPAKPSGHWWQFDYVALEWVDTRTLEEAKAFRIAAMKAARDAAWDGTFEWNGHSFDCHLVARTNIIGRAVEAQIAPQGWTTSWILADNTELTGITAADILSIGAALGQHMDAAKARYTARKAAIEAAATVAEAGAVEW